MERRGLLTLALHGGAVAPPCPCNSPAHCPPVLLRVADARALWLRFKPTSKPGQAELEMPANPNLTPPGM